MTAKVDAIRRVVRRCMPLRTPDKPEHGAYHVDAPSMQRRLARITSLVRPDERVLCVGDDDLTSLCLHWLGYRHVTLVDFDGELIETVARESKRKIQTITHDLRAVYQKRLPKLRQGFDLFVTDPPYGPDGLRVFSGVGLGALARGGHGVIVAPSKRAKVTSVGDPDELGFVLQAFLLANGAVLTDVEPHSQRSYHGTWSHMLVVRRLTQARVDFGALDGPRSFY